MHLRVNGESHEVAVDAERMLLGVLRHELGLTGTKYGCGEGTCGACTVLIDGNPTQTCYTPVSAAVGREVTTIEGLADGDELHPVQEAFVEHTAFQCAYCTSGFIMSSAALLDRVSGPDDDQIRSALSGHICRCGAYVRILQAVRSAAGKTGGEGGAR
ncbi:MAG: (2Fe-2S)-binding protein [Dehalococcoidia bacterium]|jgi:aerobic-type carbon monoxide dehydrogenase small subunit (CoxS/CutS family)|nr:(2Fe-2S)-binding protein [Dehalococcoidia bacterium]